MIVQRFIQIQTCLRIKMLCSALIYYKLLMQKGIRAFADQGDTRSFIEVLFESILFGSFGFETSFSQFTTFHDPHTHNYQ